jgi:transcriptional regulator with XRE-family HTH domain
MRIASVSFENLRAEMARKNITGVDISKSLNMTRDTLRNKLSRKSPLALDEACAIARIFFPDKDVRYLFSEVFNEAIEPASNL